jgi:L-asparaginase
MATSLPRIAVIGTGGTISSLGSSSLDVLDYPDFGQKLTCEALLDRFPETRLFADPMPVTFRQVGSTDIGPKDWVEIRSLIHRIARDEPAVAGFVIPHGTATLEETAFFLNLTLATEQPVVLVGAQRPASALGTDAGMNLVNALRVAGSPDAQGKGVLVALNDEIHAARDVVKTSTYRVQTFRSVDFGALGHVDGDGVHFFRAPLRAHMPDTPLCGPRSDRAAARRHHLFLCRRRRGAGRCGGRGRCARDRLGRVCPGKPDPRAARGFGARGKVRYRRRAVQPCDGARRPAAPPA